MELTLKQKTAFGIGAVGKDMVYALSASYVMYYYQDVLGLSAAPAGDVSVRGSFPARCSMHWCSTPCLPPRCWTKRR